jgi:DNA polymerase-3 subunit epsilon
MYTFFSLAQSATQESAWEDALRFLIRKPTLPPQLDPDIVQQLPDDPGVYIFYGERNTPLYVGKSVSIRDRVLSHFIQSSEHTKEWYMAHQIHDIKWEKTHGELSALIRESQLIKTLQPLYNRMSRQSRCMTVIRKSQHEGYDCLSFCEEEALYHDQLESVITVFPSKKSAKTFLIDACKTYQLCEKLSGIERATGASACFAYRLGKCKGACIQKEIPLAYNMRVAQAIADKRITPWPYPGMIAIEGVLFDKWCIVSDETQRFRFDVDTYRILRRHLKKAYNSATLVT